MRLAAVLLVLAGAAQADPMELACDREDGGRFTASLSEPSPDGPMHCVLAEQLEGRAPFCAPDGGWGLSAPGTSEVMGQATGPLGLEHQGGWFFARLSPSTLVASASEGSHIPYALEVSGETFWRLSLDLATLSGMVFDREGGVAFQCVRQGG